MSMRFSRWAAVVLLLLFAALYITYIQRTMQQDEAYTLRHYAVSPAHALLVYTAPNNHLLHSLLLWLSTQLIGVSLIGVRFPALAASLLALALSYRLGVRLGGPRVGLLALELIGANVAFAGYAINARGYSLTLFLTLALMALTLFPPRRLIRTWRYNLLAVSFGLVLTLPSMIIAVLAAAVWALLNRHVRAYRHMLIPLATGAAAASLFYLAAYIHGFLDEYLHGFGAADGLMSPTALLASWVDLISGTLLVDVVLIAGWVLAGVNLLRHGRSRTVWRWVVCQIGAAVVIVAMSSLTGRVLFARNFLYLLGPLSLLAALGASRLPGAVWLVVPLVGGSIVAFRSLDQPTEIDQFLAHVARNTIPGDTLIMGCCLAEPVWYHLQQSGRNDLLYVTPATRRLLLVEWFGATAASLKREYNLAQIIDECRWINSGDWSPFSIQACTLQR